MRSTHRRRVREQALALWPENLDPQSGPDLLKRLAETFALADADAKALAELCSKPPPSVVLPEFAWLTDEARPAFVRHNLRLLFGRWLAQEGLYEETVVQLEGLEPQQVVDPASLLFLSERGLSPAGAEGAGLEGHSPAAGRCGGPAAALRVGGRPDVRGPQGAEGRVAGSHLAADGRHQAPPGPGPHRPQGPQGRGRRGGRAGQADRGAGAAATTAAGRGGRPAVAAQQRRPRTAASWEAADRAKWTASPSAPRAAGATCLPSSVRKRCSRSARIFRRTIARSSSNTSASWRARRSSEVTTMNVPFL